MTPDLQRILKISVPVIVEIGRRKMPLESVIALGPGAIVELGKPAEDELDLLVNNRPIAKGTAVKVGENFGLRITRVGTQQERIAAMGK